MIRLMMILPKKSQNRTYFYMLMIILIIGAVLRLKHINQPFIDYIDWRQVSTAMMAENFYRGNWNIFLPEISWDGPGPSYNGREFQTVSYISALLYTLLGQHDWIGRSISILFGVWGIFALHQLVKRLWGQPYAIASAGMMALLPGSIFIDRSFIPDPAMVSLVVTSFWLLVVYLQSDRYIYLILAGLIGTWGFLTKITGLIVGIPMVYTIWKISNSHEQKTRSQKQLVLIILTAIIILIPVIAYYLWARHLSLTYPPYHFAGSGNWVWDDGLSKWLDKKYFLHKLYWNYEHWIWSEPFIVLIIIGLLLFPPHLKQQLNVNNSSKALTHSALWVFHCWMLAGIIYYIIGAKQLVINAWNLHILNPAAAVLAGRALVVIILWVNKIGKSWLTIFTLALILTILINSGQSHLQHMYNPPWNGKDNYLLGLALRQISQPKDLVVTIPSGTTEPVVIYYSQRRGWSFPPHEAGWWGDILKDDVEAIRLFEKLRIQGADWLGIINERKDKLLQQSPEFMEYIEKNCLVEQENEKWTIYRILSDIETEGRRQRAEGRGQRTEGKSPYNHGFAIVSICPN